MKANPTYDGMLDVGVKQTSTFYNVQVWDNGHLSISEKKKKREDTVTYEETSVFFMPV